MLLTGITYRNTCRPNPCQNGGRCRSFEPYLHRCYGCPSGFRGRDCEPGKSQSFHASCEASSQSTARVCTGISEMFCTLGWIPRKRELVENLASRERRIFTVAQGPSPKGCRESVTPKKLIFVHPRISSHSSLFGCCTFHFEGIVIGIHKIMIQLLLLPGGNHLNEHELVQGSLFSSNTAQPSVQSDKLPAILVLSSCVSFFFLDVCSSEDNDASPWSQWTACRRGREFRNRTCIKPVYSFRSGNFRCIPSLFSSRRCQEIVVRAPEQPQEPIPEVTVQTKEPSEPEVVTESPPEPATTETVEATGMDYGHSDYIDFYDESVEVPTARLSLDHI